MRFAYDQEFQQYNLLACYTLQTAASFIYLPENDGFDVKASTGITLTEEWPLAAMARQLQKHPFVEINDGQAAKYTGNNLSAAYPGYGSLYAFAVYWEDGRLAAVLCLLNVQPRTLETSEKDIIGVIIQRITALAGFKKVQEDTTYLTRIYDVSGGLLIVVDDKAVIRRINHGAVQVLGWCEEHFLGKPVLDFIHPDDIASATHEIQKLGTGMPTIRYTVRFITEWGDYRVTEWNATPNTHTGYIYAVGRDITQEEKQSEALRTSEMNFQALIHNTNGLICKHDLAGNIVMVNKAGADSLGYSLEELTAKSLFDILPEAQHDNLQKYLQKIATDGQLNGLMYPMHKNGSVRIWLFSNVLVQDAANTCYVIGNAVDITERNELQRELRQTKEVLERISRVARIGTWEYNLITGQIYWSAITRQIHEVESSYLPTLDNAIGFYKKEDQEKLKNGLQLAVSSQMPYDLELEIISAKGNKVWVRAIGDTEFNNGVCQRVYGTFQDIDQKKKAELAIQQSTRLLHDVLESASEVCIIATDRKGIITLFNNGAEKLLGYPAASLIGKKNLEMLMLPSEIQQRSVHIANTWQVQAEGFAALTYIAALQGAEKCECSFVTCNGDNLIVSQVVTPIRDEYQQISGFLSIAVDITEARRQREALEKATTVAEQASKAKSEFLANMSHEIRTPLNGIIGFADLVAKTALSEMQHQYISVIHQSANILLSIINDILDFSKIEAGKLELDISRTDLFDFCSHATDLLSYQAQQKGIEMLLNISTALPRFAWIDNVRLKQILVNLLSNAVKFTGQGEIELTVEPVATSGNGHTTLRFSVRDTGIGIKAEKQEDIFEAFSQEDISTTKKYGGTGLGLTISNRLLLLMHSRLQLQSEPEKGSTFFFEIEVKTEEGIPVEWENINHLKRALIVDNNEHNCTIIEKMLQLKEISSDIAHNGLEALQLLLNDNDYDVILIDYHMPFMDGLETIRKIRSHSGTLQYDGPVVLLHSSADDDELLRTCKELKINQRLVKPIKIQEMYYALSHLYVKPSFQSAGPANPLPEHVSIGENIHVLIAEDNMVNMQLARTIVHKNIDGVIIHEAKNGAEAIDICKRITPDIILMDIQMPEINGLQATETIRKMHKNVPIIALTAGNVKGEKEKCMAVGMDDFITKPFVERILITTIIKWIKQPEAEQTFDAGVMKKNMGSLDDETIRLLLGTSLDDLEKAAVSLQEGYALNDLQRLKQTGHGIKGVAATVGLTALSQAGFELEITENSQYLQATVAKVQEQLHKGIAAVQQFLSREG